MRFSPAVLVLVAMTLIVDVLGENGEASDAARRRRHRESRHPVQTIDESKDSIKPSQPIKEEAEQALSVAPTAGGGGLDRPDVVDQSNLTGRWSCDDGLNYLMRQVGDELWWFASPQKIEGRNQTDFLNAFHGTIEGNLIKGSWTDTPIGQMRSGGKLSLQIVRDDQGIELRKTKETGGFGGRVWRPAPIR